MKKIMPTLLTFVLGFNSVLANTVMINIRDENKDLKTIPMDLSALSTGHLAEDENFKILKATGKETIDLTSPEMSSDELLRAATVLHHLKIARNYFINVHQSDFVKNHPQISVRIDMNLPFNEFFHFIPQSKMTQFNNAVTVPPSDDKAKPDIERWGTEIWFRPAADEKIDNTVYQVGKVMDEMDLSATMMQTLTDQNLRSALTSSIVTESLSSVDYIGFISSLLYAVGVFKLTPKILMFATGPIKTTTYLDTAMIPEVIYHEFTHVALSDKIKNTKSTPLNEGIANYFAAVINKSEKIGDKTEPFSKNTGSYDGTQNQMYQSRLETKNAAHSNFVFSFLWKLRQKMTTEFPNGENLADKLIYNSRKYLHFVGKPIKDDLLPALQSSAGDVVPKSQARRLRMIILDVATNKGI